MACILFDDNFLRSQSNQREVEVEMVRVPEVTVASLLVSQLSQCAAEKGESLFAALLDGQTLLAAS
jgi:hypothetical protein